MTFRTTNPLALAEELWPQYRLYDRQRELTVSLWENHWTVAPAAHMVGKDFWLGMACVLFFLTRTPCRIVTTSVDYKQLEVVLWGEIKRFVQDSKVPLTADRGGPLVFNHLHVRKLVKDPRTGRYTREDGLSYMIGRVARGEEGMSGHHVAQTGDGVPRTLFAGDEASGIPAATIAKATEWANRGVLIGNPYECQNQFKWASKGTPDRSDPGGDLLRDPLRPERGYFRRVIRIRGVDSPNVRVGLLQRARGEEPTNEILVPGVLPYEERELRLRTWDRVKLCVGDSAEFYEGAEVLLYPPEWLNRAEDLHAELLVNRVARRARAVGVDPGEGGANTAMAAADEYGVIEVVGRPTPDTSVIAGEALAFARRHGVPDSSILFDRGGGGKQVADLLRSKGHDVRTVPFGESLVNDPQPNRAKQRVGGPGGTLDDREERYAYATRRVQMYAELSLLLDPALDPSPLLPVGSRAAWEGRWADGRHGYALPPDNPELRRQLAPIPKQYDGEGRLTLPPKSSKPGDAKDRVTLSRLIGRSPDEADAVVLAVHGVLHPLTVRVPGGF